MAKTPSHDNGIYYFIGNITSHAIHAFPLWKRMGGTFVVTSLDSKTILEKYHVPVVCVDNRPYRWQKPGRIPRKVREYILLDARMKKTYDFLNSNAKIVIFYELFELKLSYLLVKPYKVFFPHGNMLKDYMKMYPKRLEIINDYDYMAALGPYMKQQFLHDGIDKRKLVDVGIARTDQLYEAKQSKKEIQRKISQSLNLSPKQKTVVYAPTFWGASSVYTTGIEIMRHISSKYNFIFRPHPQTPKSLLSQYRSIAKKTQNISIVEESSSSPSLVDILVCADAIIVDISSVALEAILLDTPLIFAYDELAHRQTSKDYTSITNVVEYSQKLDPNSAQSVNNIIEKSIDAGVNAKEWAKAKKNNFYHYEGNAIESIIQFLESIKNRK